MQSSYKFKTYYLQIFYYGAHQPKQRLCLQFSSAKSKTNPRFISDVHRTPPNTYRLFPPLVESQKFFPSAKHKYLSCKKLFLVKKRFLFFWILRIDIFFISSDYLVLKLDFFLQLSQMAHSLVATPFWITGSYKFLKFHDQRRGTWYLQQFCPIIFVQF